LDCSNCVSIQQTADAIQQTAGAQSAQVRAAVTTMHAQALKLGATLSELQVSAMVTQPSSVLRQMLCQ
jgi:hypothetical protein